MYVCGTVAYLGARYSSPTHPFRLKVYRVPISKSISFIQRGIHLYIYIHIYVAPWPILEPGMDDPHAHLTRTPHTHTSLVSEYTQCPYLTATVSSLFYPRKSQRLVHAHMHTCTHAHMHSIRHNTVPHA